jgi:hypothetical protein
LVFAGTFFGGAILFLADVADLHERCECPVDQVFFADEVQLAWGDLHGWIGERRAVRTL